MVHQQFLGNIRHAPNRSTSHWTLGKQMYSPRDHFFSSYWWEFSFGQNQGAIGNILGNLFGTLWEQGKPAPPPKRKKLDRLLPPSKIEQNSNVSKLQWFPLYTHNYVSVQSIWVLLFGFGSSKLFCFCWICEYFQAFTSPRLVVEFSKFWFVSDFLSFFFPPPVAMIFFFELGFRV